MRRVLLTLSAALVLAVFTNPVDAQLKFGAHGAMITGLDQVLVNGTDVNAIDGTVGIGGRVMLDPPLFPLAVVGSYTKYFPDGDGSAWTGTLAAQLRIPLPIVKPYVTGGWQMRPEVVDGVSANGPMVGLGVQVDLGLSLFLEGTFELSSELDPADLPGLAAALDQNRIVIKGGLMFG